MNPFTNKENLSTYSLILRTRERCRGLATLFLIYIFPSRCLGCRAPETLLCRTCLERLTPADDTETHVKSAWSYKDPIVRSALWKLKYHGKKEVASVCAEALNDLILEELADETLFANFGTNDAVLLIPIPLSKKDKRARGYNQSELIARALAPLSSAFKLELDTKSLQKNRETPKQARIKNRAQRLKNIRGAFTVTDSEKITGRDIIVIDDVTTTGATLSEVRKTLLNAGAKRVLCFSVAH